MKEGMRRGGRKEENVNVSGPKPATAKETRAANGAGAAGVYRRGGGGAAGRRKTGFGGVPSTHRWWRQPGRKVCARSILEHVLFHIREKDGEEEREKD